MANSFFHNQILHVKTEFNVKIHSFSFTLHLRLYKKTLNLHACTEREKVPQVSFSRSHSTVSTSSELGYKITPSHLDFYMGSEAHTQVVMIALQALFQLTCLPRSSLQLWEEMKCTGTWKEWPWPRSTEKSSCLITILWKGDVRQHQGPLTANSWGPDMPSHSSKSQPCNSSSMRQSEGHAQCFVRQALGVPLVFVRVKSG